MDIASNAVTNIISGLALLVSLIVGGFYFLDRKHAKYAIENDYVSKLLSWHGEVVEVLIRLKASSSGEDASRKGDLCRLSALIEQGRFFFPNIRVEEGYGADKPPAYRGYRNLALDMLVASYNIHQKTDASNNLRQAETLHRHFTSIVYEIVRPQHRLDEIRKLTDKYFAPEKSFEDFLDRNDPVAIEFIWQKKGGTLHNHSLQARRP